MSRRFGGAVALHQVSFEAAPGRVVGVIGPNGSGKTTLLNVINGVHRPTRGSIALDGHRIDGISPHRLIRLGVSRTFQNPRVFQSLTVWDILLMMSQSVGRQRQDEARASELLDLVGLAGSAGELASELSGGQKKLAEFARALMIRPRLVLMDEPFAGIHPVIKQSLMSCIRETCNRWGITYLVVSHEVGELVALSDEFLCLAQGRVLAAGDPAAVGADPAVIEAYLGAPAGAR